jgi:peptidoglycan hydrolase-like protein with peptidoglycan-binding domain
MDLIYPEKKVDGYYGPATRLAVYRWQKANGVRANVLGNVDAKTRTALANCKRTGLTYASTATYSYSSRSVAQVSFTTSGCPVFGRSLSRGSSGSDVQALQSFLINKNLLSSDSVTGYFGALTEHGLQQWQSAAGIISSGDASTGFGVLGPRTRAAVAQNCTLNVTGNSNTTASASAVNCLNTKPATCATGYVPGGTCNLICVIDTTPPPAWVTQMLQNPAPPPAPTPTPTPSPTPTPTPTQTPTSFSQNGLAASISVMRVSGSPYTVSFSGTYNSNSACDSAQFNLGYGDETSDTFSSSCTATAYAKIHTFTGPGVYDAYIAKITTDSTGVQNFDYQAELEITINNDGSMQFGLVPPDTTASASQMNVASALAALQYALQSLVAYLNRH